MDFLTVLVGNNWAFGGSRVGTENNAVLEDDANNGCAGLGGFWDLDSFASQCFVSKFRGDTQWGKKSSTTY